jgi:hypothetical protein
MKKLTIKKTIFLPVFLFLLIGTIYAFSVPNSEPANEQVGLQFGKQINCIGQGLCLMVPPDEFEGGSFDAMGEIIVGMNGKMSLKIDKNSISVAKAEEQFGNLVFEIKENIEIMPTATTNSAQRGNSTLTIQKGLFPVVEDEESYTISF